ncbi:ornithine decarboxylase-like [Chironomus tepperi]|uniref:ornithine decarboxylase-like n=1 Tax=Chironomus tepperi TaxID=113505 RepID=UPI00391FBECF
MKLTTENEDDRIHIMDDDVNSTELINQLTLNGTINQEDPFYIFNIGDIIKKHQNWIEKMPRVAPYYAVKCNDNDVVLATLALLGTSFDCASKGEMSKVLSLGVKPDRIIFANPAKSKSALMFAKMMGIKMMTFDCEIELQKIKTLYPDASLVLRIVCEAEIAQCALGKKFGCDPLTEAPKLLKAAKQMGLNVVGISFHVGSGCKDYPVYNKAIRFCRDLFDEAKGLGFELSVVDIGGGFPGDNDKDIDEVSMIVNDSLERYFPDERVQVIAEPGRYYVASAFTLVTNIFSKKNIMNQATNEPDRMMLYLNDGVYASFNCLLYDHQVVKPILLKKSNHHEKKIKSTIFGPTCDALDEIISDIELPLATDVGDFMFFENMGAYTLPVASPFNGFPLPKIFYFIERALLEEWFVLPIEGEDYVQDFIGKTIDCNSV